MTRLLGAILVYPERDAADIYAKGKNSNDAKATFEQNMVLIWVDGQMDGPKALDFGLEY